MNFSIQFTCDRIGHYAIFYFAQKLDAIRYLKMLKILKHLIEGSEKTGDNDAPRLSMDNMNSLVASKKSFWKDFLIEDFSLIEWDFASNVKFFCF